jgi:hypothetical protein
MWQMNGLRRNDDPQCGAAGIKNPGKAFQISVNFTPGLKRKAHCKQTYEHVSSYLLTPSNSRHPCNSKTFEICSGRQYINKTRLPFLQGSLALDQLSIQLVTWILFQSSFSVCYTP